MKGKIYEPAEDSLLLSCEVAKFLEGRILRNPDIKLLDMGAGSGIISETALKAGCKKENILAADINSSSVSLLKKKGFNVVTSNLFSRIKGRFDVIAFNPPYLPVDRYDKGIDTCGGRKGFETALRFVRGLRQHLSSKGVALLLISSLTNPEAIKKEILRQRLSFKQLCTKRIFFEELYVWLIHQ